MFKQKFWYAEVLIVVFSVNIPAIILNYFEPENWFVWYALAVGATSATVFILNKIRRVELFKSPAWSWEILVIYITEVFAHRLLLAVVVGGTHHDFFLSTPLIILSAGIAFLAAFLLHKVPEEKKP